MLLFRNILVVILLMSFITLSVEPMEVFSMPSIHAGWPQMTREIGFPAIADIDNDGKLEIVSVDDTSVKAWYHDGKPVIGWPQTTPNSEKISYPALGDVDNDGYMEIFAAGWQHPVFDYSMYAWHHDGQVVNGWPVKTKGLMGLSPTLADVDNDGFMDVLAGSQHGFLYIWNKEGQSLPGWPVSVYDHVSSPSVGDLDGDGLPEIVAMMTNMSVSEVGVWHSDGTILSGWPQKVDSNYSYTSPVLGDIDFDGDLEIVAGAGQKIYVWHHTGKIVSGWPKTIAKPIQEGFSLLFDLGVVKKEEGWPQFVHSPVLADIDGVNGLEILISTSDWQIYAWHYNGSQVTGWPISTFNPVAGRTISPPSIGDITNDGKMEVLAAIPCSKPDLTEARVYAWHYDGTLAEGWPISLPEGAGANYISTPALGDVDNDGLLEMVIAGWQRVYIYDLDSIYNESKMEWDQFKYDARHTGCKGSAYYGIPTCDINGDSVVDILDLVIIGRDFGESLPNNPRADENGDGVVNMLDLEAVVQYFDGICLQREIGVETY